MKKDGFSIIEAMVVFAVLGIILGITIPSFRNYIPRMRLKGARDEVLSALQLAQTKAVSERRVYQVIFEENSYRFNPDTTSALRYLPQGISIVGSDEVTFEFHPDHTAKVFPCNLTIENTKYKSVTFSVIEATGYIKVEE